MLVKFNRLSISSQSSFLLRHRCRRSSTHRSLTSYRSNQRIFAEMNITRHNFRDHFDDLKADIQKDTCRFIAIDTEFTGLSPSEEAREKYIDTLEERYQKVKQGGESFLITQFGLSTGHIEEDGKTHVKVWNFYVFPRPYGNFDVRFLCQASSLQFLSEHGFDFNKFIADGIPYITLSKTKEMKEQVEKKIDRLDNTTRQLYLTKDPEVKYQADVKAKMEEWIKSDSKKGKTLYIESPNSFYRLIVHETVRSFGDKYYSEWADGGIEVSVVTKKERETIIAEKSKKLRDELDDAIGFSRIIELLSESKKPIVGHNALLDFVYVFNQFYQPLPNTLNEFKTQLLKLFPRIYDTKYITLSSALGSQLQSTSLSALFEYMQAKVKPSPESLLCTDSRFDQYRKALSDEANDNEKMPCHEAGFDAFMTSVCFLGLISHDKDGKVLEPLWPAKKTAKSKSSGTKDTFDTRFSQLDSYQNKMNLMISDGMLIDLTNLGQTIDRSRVFRISSTKRKLNSVNIDSYFRPKKIIKVIKENEKEAFVFLSEEEQKNEDEANDEEEEQDNETQSEVADDQEDSKKKKKKSKKTELNIVPYDEYIASGGKATYGLLNELEEGTKTSASRKHEPMPEVKEGRSSCVIS